MSIKTPNEPQADDLGELKKAEPAPPPPVDSYTRISESVWKNDRTGAFETFNHRPGKAQR